MKIRAEQFHSDNNYDAIPFNQRIFHQIVPTKKKILKQTMLNSHFFGFLSFLTVTNFFNDFFLNRQGLLTTVNMKFL